MVFKFNQIININYFAAQYNEIQSEMMLTFGTFLDIANSLAEDVVYIYICVSHSVFLILSLK